MTIFAIPSGWNQIVSYPAGSPTMVMVAMSALQWILRIVDDDWMSERNSVFEKISTVDWLSSKIHALGLHLMLPFF